MSSPLHTPSSRAQVAAKTPGHSAFNRSAALLAVLFVAVLSFAACSSSKKAGVLTSVAVTPATASIAVTGTQQFTATGTFNDGSTQDITSSVTWSSSNTATATISASGLATGVASGTATITATSGTFMGNATLTVATLTSIAVTAPTLSIAVGATDQFTAIGTFSDGTTQDLTTTAIWASSVTTVATITSPGGLATGVSAGTTMITAMSGTVTSPPVTLTVTTTTGGSNALLTGQYALLLSGTDSFGGSYSFAGSITADGLGGITPGVIDFADTIMGSTTDTTVTGTYTIGADGRGMITLNTGDLTFGVAGVVTLGVSMTGNQHGLIIEEDTSSCGSGSLDFQDANSFLAANITGGYAFAFSGVDIVNGTPLDASGVFTGDGASMFTNGTQDVVDGGTTNLSGSLAGTFTPPDPTNGRGTAILNGSGNYAYYSVGGTTLNFIEIDATNLLAGSAFTQGTSTFSNASLAAGSYAFTSGGTDIVNNFALAVGGLLTSDGNGNLSTGTLDVNDGGTFSAGALISGTYSIAANGRGTATIVGGNSFSSVALYPTASNGILLLEIDGNGFQSSGAAFLQSGTFGATSLSGPYAVNFTGINASSQEHDLIGQVTADAAGMLTLGHADINVFGAGVTLNGTLTGTYTAVSDGRFAGTLIDPTSTQNVEFYVVGGSSSPNTALFISLDPAQVNSGVMEGQPSGFPAGHSLRISPAHVSAPRLPVPAGHRQGTRVPVK